MHHVTRPVIVIAGFVSTVGRVLSAAVRMTLSIGVLAVCLVGAPWALAVFIGWPLPTEVPTWADLQRLWDTPASPELIFDVLAVACWVVWLVFVRDVLRCVHAAARGLDWSRVRPGALQALIGTMVGAVLGWLLTHRASAGAGLGPLAPVDVQAWARPVASITTLAHHYTGLTNSVTAPLGQPDASTAGAVEVVRAPEDGICDSLWRIAERTLGDGNRWPELYALTAGMPQPDGRTLDDPNLIYPGWIIRLPPPSPAASPVPPQSTPAPLVPTQPPTPTDEAPDDPPSTVPAGEKDASRTPTLPMAPDDRVPGFQVGPETFLGLGVAAVLSAVLLRRRARRRGAYTAGSGDRSDLHAAPVVRAVHAAHIHATRPPDDDPPLSPTRQVIGGDGACTRDGVGDALDVVEIGVREGLAIALDLARTRGLGLVGPGAARAARAILLGLLASPIDLDDARTEVLLPVADAETLIGPAANGPALVRIHLADSVEMLLDDLEITLLARLREQTDPHTGQPRPRGAPLTVIATPTPRSTARLQAVLDNGAALRITGILLGQWRPGATLYVLEDGTVDASSPGLTRSLAGARLFGASQDHLTDLLGLLRDDGHREHTRHGPDTAPPCLGTSLPASDPWRGRTNASAEDDPLNLADTPARQPSTADSHRVPPAVDAAQAEGQAPDMRRSSSAKPDTQELRVPETGTGTDARGRGSSDAQPARSRPGSRLLVATIGPLRLHWQDPEGTARSVTHAFGPRQLELILVLAMHPDGVHSDQILDTLWGEYTGSAQPRSSLHATLNRLRTSLSKAADDPSSSRIVLHEDSRYRLDPELVDVDLWPLLDALSHARSADPDIQHRARRQVAATYTARLADGLTTDWIDTPRETLHRDATDAIAALSHAQADIDPAGALELAELVRAHDPYNEPIYQHIMRLQARLGRREAVLGTLNLLATRLAELDAQPTADTVRLATDLAAGPLQ